MNGTTGHSTVAVCIHGVDVAAVRFRLARMNKLLLASFLLPALLILAGIILSPHAPETMATHWDIFGQPNGFMPKTFGLFFMPAFTILLSLVLYAIPKLDPLKENIASFRTTYDSFILLFVVFFSYVHILATAWNFGYAINLTQWMLPPLGGLFWYTGALLEATKRNYFIGIRTPWTLSSDAVWDKTHVLGGKLFKVSGILTALSACIPTWGFFILLGTILGSTIATTVYSYIMFKKETTAQQ